MRQRSQWVKLFICCRCQLVLELIRNVSLTRELSLKTPDEVQNTSTDDFLHWDASNTNSEVRFVF